MTRIEALAYSPNNMEEFLKFFVAGKKNAKGDYETDEYDRLITGVIPWLHGREIPKANFFSSKPGAPIQLFVAVIEAPETEGVPWMRRIPGFAEMVRADGLVGVASDLAALAAAGMTTPSTWVEPRPELDEIFDKAKERIGEIVFDKRTFTKDEFLMALQGRAPSYLNSMFAEITSVFNKPVIESLS